MKKRTVIIIVTIIILTIIMVVAGFFIARDQYHERQWEVAENWEPFSEFPGITLMDVLADAYNSAFYWVANKNYTEWEFRARDLVKWEDGKLDNDNIPKDYSFFSVDEIVIPEELTLICNCTNGIILKCEWNGKEIPTDKAADILYYLFLGYMEYNIWTSKTEHHDNSHNTSLIQQKTPPSSIKTTYCTYCNDSGYCPDCIGLGSCNICFGTFDYCTSCVRSGDCQTCYGQGGQDIYVFGGDNQWVICTSCNGSGICRTCNGSKKNSCYACNGDGKCTVCDGDMFCPYCS